MITSRLTPEHEEAGQIDYPDSTFHNITPEDTQANLCSSTSQMDKDDDNSESDSGVGEDDDIKESCNGKNEDTSFDVEGV